MGTRLHRNLKSRNRSRIRVIRSSVHLVSDRNIARAPIAPKLTRGTGDRYRRCDGMPRQDRSSGSTKLSKYIGEGVGQRQCLSISCAGEGSEKLAEGCDAGGIVKDELLVLCE